MPAIRYSRTKRGWTGRVMIPRRAGDRGFEPHSETIGFARTDNMYRDSEMSAMHNCRGQLWCFRSHNIVG